MRRYLWVIERKINSKWVALIHGVFETKREAKHDMDCLKGLYPDEQYQIRKYIPND